MERFRREAEARYAEIGASARAIRDAAVRGAGAARAVVRRRPPSLAHAVRQLRGLERALRLERRRDYFRAAGRDAASGSVSAAIAELEAQLAGRRGRSQPCSG